MSSFSSYKKENENLFFLSSASCPYESSSYIIIILHQIFAFSILSRLVVSFPKKSRAIEKERYDKCNADKM